MNIADKKASFFALITGLLIAVSNIQSLFGYNAHTMDVFMGAYLALVGCYARFGSQTRKGALIFTGVAFIIFIIEMIIIYSIGSISNNKLIIIVISYLSFLVAGIYSALRPTEKSTR